MSDDQLEESHADKDLAPNSIPRASPPLQRPEVATSKINNPKEQFSDSPVPDLPNGEVPYHALTRLMVFHPCVAFFGWVADQQFPRSQTRETRFRKHGEEHPPFYWICVVIDLTLIIIAWAIIMIAICITIYKTLWL